MATGLTAAPAAAAAPSVLVAYVTNAHSDSVLPIRIPTPEEFAPLSPIQTGFDTDPTGIAADPSGEGLYVALSTEPPANEAGHTLDALSTLTGQILEPALETGTWPLGVAAAPDGQDVFVADQGSDSLDDFFPGSKGVEVERVSLAAATPNEAGKPQFVASAPGSEAAYVTVQDYDSSVAQNYSSLVPVDLTESGDRLGTPILLSSSCEPEGVAIAPDGETAVVACGSGDAVDVVDLKTDALTRIQLNSRNDSSGIGSAAQVAIAPNGETALVTWKNDIDGGVVNVIDLKTLESTDTLTIPDEDPDGIAITPDGQTALIAGRATGRIFVVHLGGPEPQLDPTSIPDPDGEAAGPSMIALTQVPLPVASTPPTIAGTAVVGDALVEAHGTWSASPTAFSYQWQRCESSGSGCVSIPGASAQSYTPTEADAGHELRVLETAANAAGSGSAASSTATAVVAPPSAPAGGGSSGGGAGQPGSAGGSGSGAASGSAGSGNSHGQGRGGSVHVLHGSTVVLKLTCTGGSCAGVLELVVVEKIGRSGRLVAVQAKRRGRGTKTKAVVIGSTRVSLHGGASATVRISLNAIGSRLLRRRGVLRARLLFKQSLDGRSRTTKLARVTLRRR